MGKSLKSKIAAVVSMDEKMKNQIIYNTRSRIHSWTEILRRSMPKLHEKYKVRNLGIFGSYARNESLENSDLDLLVEFEKPIGWAVVDLKDFLESLLGIKVDLVPKNAAVRKKELWKSIQEDLINV